MKLRSAVRLAIVTLAVTILALGVKESAVAQQPEDLSAFAGRWQMNPTNTKLLKYGLHGKNKERSDTYTFVFTPAGNGLKYEVYNQFPQPSPSRSILIIPDRKARLCDGACVIPGVQPGQTYTYYAIDPHMLVRSTIVAGKVIEFNTYAVSVDGKKLSMITFSTDTPEWQDVYSFEKQP